MTEWTPHSVSRLAIYTLFLNNSRLTFLFLTCYFDKSVEYAPWTLAGARARSALALLALFTKIIVFKVGALRCIVDILEVDLHVGVAHEADAAFVLREHGEAPLRPSRGLI